MKRTIAILLCLFLIGTLALSVSAASAHMSLSSSAGTVYRGDTFSLTVTLSNDQPVSNGGIVLSYDSSAFELLGGETYLEQNEYQVFKYEQARARGLDFPVVGSSDGHSTINNPGWNVGATMVFAPENERKSLIESIKDKYTVCIDNISREPRLAGDFRFVQFGRFLLEYYFPLHDELCFEEGRLMKDYRCGDEKAAELLNILHGRVEALQKKYFAY